MKQYALLIISSLVIVSSIASGFVLLNKLPNSPKVDTQVRIENSQYPPEPVTVIATTVEASSVGESQKNLFHASFFNSYMSEWGILSRYDEPVKVTVTFSQPTKIQGISNIFTGCDVPDCYQWSAEGITQDNKVVTLVKNAIATNFNPSEETIISDEVFEKVVLTAERIKGDRKPGVEWKKMSFKYK